MSNAAIYKPVTRAEEGAGEKPSPINKVLFQAPTRWPEQDPPETSALCAIGNEVGLGAYPRAAFCSRTLDWGNVRTDVADATFAKVNPAPSCGYFSKSDFDGAQRELNTGSPGGSVKARRAPGLQSSYRRCASRGRIPRISGTPDQEVEETTR
jgi:hypothetical protein